MRALIVGGGIAGLSSAIALQQRGHVVTIVERTRAWTPVGAGIVLSVNAMRVLRRLGVADEITRRGHVVREAVVTDERGRLLQRLPIAALGAGEVSVAIHRGDLHAVLLGANQQATVHLGKSVKTIRDGDGPVTVTLSDDTELTANFVVGADGIRSQVRDLIFGASAARYAGYTCWRFVCPNSSGVSDPVEMWGRGMRFGLVPLAEQKLYCFATRNLPAATAEPENNRLDHFRQLFAAFAGNVPAALAAIAAPEQLIRNDLEDVLLKSWHRGRVVLIGDAAHASTPNMGQGAAMAIEDAFVLAEELKAQSDIALALARFEERRRARVRWVQSQSRKIGAIGQWSSRFACALRNSLVRMTPDRLASASLRRLLNDPI